MTEHPTCDPGLSVFPWSSPESILRARPNNLVQRHWLRHAFEFMAAAILSDKHAGDLRRCAAGSRNPPRRTASRDYSALAAAVKAANLTKLAAFAAAETAKQAAIEKARDTPHATGDNAAV